MNTAVKLTRTSTPSLLYYSPTTFPSINFGRNLKAPAGIRFQQAKAGHEMDQGGTKSKPADKTEEPNKSKSKSKSEHGDAVMTESFGEGYSTRSNEEGFGGIYGRNEEEGGEKVHGITAEHEDYNKTQGSEAKEKERHRNQE